MSNALNALMEALTEGRQDLEDAYAGKTKVSATRARKTLAAIKKAAHEARQEVLAISKGEAQATPVDLSLLDCDAVRADDSAEDSDE